ncbi:MAG: methionyl-tRNA formyltransferase [Bdellovibrionales bacterium]|nr:methionyl-tRNA formyltransferase [Bdellovibrionales bacterium]
MKSSAFPVLFLGTDHIALKGLNRFVQHLRFDVKGVVTQVPKKQGRGRRCLMSPVARKAQELSLPVLIPDNLKSPEFLSQVKDLRASWAVLLSYGKILPKDFLSLFPGRALNFHASLLPRWKGAAPIQRAIMAGDETLGMSLQVMESKLDTGPLIGTRMFKMEMEMDAVDVFNKMDFLIQELLSDLLEYMKGNLVPVPQGESSTLYAHKIDKKESQIVWQEPALKIFNHIRALVIGPQAYTFYKGKRLKIYKARYPSEEHVVNTPGQIVELSADSFKVACRDSVLSVIQLQPESKNIMSAGEYIRGYNIKKGDIFN